MDSYKYNLEPFKEIKRFITYRDIVGTTAFLINIGGNVIAFMPFGFLVPQMTKGKSGFFKTLCLSFLLTLLIETTQLITKLGRFDVDDIILNTLGGVAGFLVYEVCHIVHSRKRRNK